MYTYEFPVQSRKPEQIVSFDTLIYPFDEYVWCFTLSFVMAIFVVLLLMQRAWFHASGEQPANGWIFQGSTVMRYVLSFHLKINMDIVIKSSTSQISDIVLALSPMVDEPMPNAVPMRSSFTRSRRLLILQWLICAAFLSHGYKSTLLSTLIAIRYTAPLDNLDQMVESGLPFYVFTDNNLFNWVANTDPRESVKRLNERQVKTEEMDKTLDSV